MFRRFRALAQSKKFIGKLVQITLEKGYVYGLCTHDLYTDGQVIKMYKGLYSSPLEDPETTLATAEVRTWIKFPLKYVLKEPEVLIVGSKALSKQEKVLPKFRSLGLFAPNESPSGWWIIDGDKEVWVKALTSEMAHYPDDGIYSLGAIQHLYVMDIYPHSKANLELGPLTFPLSELQ
jgi:hypothetical protein